MPTPAGYIIRERKGTKMINNEERNKQIDEAIMEETENLKETTGKYDDLWAVLADPSIDEEMTDIVLKKLKMTPEELIKLFKDSRKKTEPAKNMNPEDRYKKALAKSLDSMKIPKKFVKHLDFSNPDTEEIKATVSQYYSIQSQRIALNNQVKAAQKAGAECTMLEHYCNQFMVTEKNIKIYLDTFTDNHPVCEWMKSITGIGPVIAAGIISYFDITKAKTTGAFLRYIGWDGETPRRKRGEKLTYNPKARTLCWKLGNSFRMRYMDPSCYYGKLYEAKKAYYKEKNDNLEYAERAKIILSEYNYSDGTSSKEAYLAGKLPDAQIDAMAIRFCIKIFLSHLFDVWYMWEYGEYPPVPYAKAHLGHVHIDAVPNWEIIKHYLDAKYPDVVWDVNKIYR